MTTLSTRESAQIRLTRTQGGIGVFFLVVLAIGGLLAWRTTVTLLLGAGTAFYLFSLVWKARLIHAAYVGLPKREPVTLLDDADLPRYTILVPLYHEGAVAAAAVRHLMTMDYPKDRLEILLLCETGDDETLSAVNALTLPPFVHVVVCAPGIPQTKPRACNLGLARATGELLVIYDAEDRPALDQLRIAASTFAHDRGAIGCLQARLDYHNSRHNWLTRFFTVEYNHWFALLLPTLAERRLPIPLGGTSNHFRTRVLREVRGWDAWNVAEDADLGVRLYAAGYDTGMIDSVTWEEACSRLGPWMRQRTRWIKGYMMTFLVNTRSVSWVARRDRPVSAVAAFAALIPGTPLVLLMNPIFWGLLLVHAVTRSQLIVELIPGPVLYPGVVSLVIGNALFIYVNMAAVDYHRRWHLGRAALLSPVYWCLLSVAAWRALLQLVTQPHLWEKTPHGLSESDKLAEAANG